MTPNPTTKWYLLALAILVPWLLSCSAQEPTAVEVELGAAQAIMSRLDTVSAAQAVQMNRQAEHPAAPYESAIRPEDALGEYIGLCEPSLATVRMDEDGNPIKPERRKISKAEQNRMRRHIQIIAREMGADPRLFLIWGLRESSYRWYKRHQLNPDMEAASVAWRKYRHTDHRAAELRAEMENKPGTQAYWSAKAELERISIYAENPTYEAAQRWAVGYGLYGMQPIYHLKRWDPEVAPEILCDPVVATVTAIWAARSGRDVCASTGHGSTYAAVNRVFSTGHCEPSGREHYFERRAERHDLDPASTAQLGTKWPQKSTDRAEILTYMRDKVAEDDAARGI